MPAEPAPESKDYLPPSQFLKFLENNDFIRHRPNQPTGDFTVTYLDLTPIHLNVGLYVPFFVPNGLPVGKLISSDQIDALVEKVRVHKGDNSRYFSILVIGNHIQYEPGKRRRNIGRHDLVVLDLPTMRNIMAAGDDDDLRDRLTLAFLNYLGREKLSPYQHSTVAVAGRFFGRAEIFRKVKHARSTSLVFAGNRRIGKTSLLMELSRQMQRSNTEIAWVYGNTCHSTLEVLSKIIADLREDTAGRAVGDPLFLEKFPSLVQHIPEQQDRDVAIVIDELDHILDFDEKQGFDLLERLRGLALHARCRIFMAGFRKTMDASRRSKHPLYNLAQSHPIAGLSRKEVTEMVSVPLTRLQIKFDPNLTVAIENETSGQPELVQVFCDIAVRQFEETRKEIAADELLREVFADRTFREKVLGSFLTNFNPSEKLACYLIFQKIVKDSADFDKYEFGLNELDSVLHGYLDLDETRCNVLLNNLEAGGAIVNVKHTVKYRIAVPQLGRYHQEKIAERVANAKNDLVRDPQSLEALLSEPESSRGGA